MLKTRVVGVVLVRGGVTVQSIGFRTFLPVGRPEIAIEYLDRWGIDEIVLLQTDAGGGGGPVLASQVALWAKQCHVPLSGGGGISDVSTVQELIHAGADKVVLNSALISTPEVLTQAAERFGSQCVVASIDARRGGDGRYMTYVQGGRVATGATASELAARAEALGAGEILITSIDRDGSKQGFDLGLTRETVRAVRIPVIACGGAGHPAHLREAMQTGAAAVAAANFFHFTEHSVVVAKRALVEAGEPVRLDSYVSYEGCRMDAAGRATKLADDRLEALRFQYIPEEVI
jgi:cyclase